VITKTPHLCELGEFLRLRRGELTPAEVGLPEHGAGRRRVEGLRREEVAQLVAISPDYYMRIEQGRLAPSPPVLAGIVRALRLDADQVTYVEGLVSQAGHQVRPRRRTKRVEAHPQLERLMHQLTETPAIVFGPRLDVLAWNPLAAEVFMDFSLLADGERNYVRLVFTDPRMRGLFADWESVARRGVEFLRMEAGDNPSDPSLTALVGELSIADQQFREWWAAHHVAHQEYGTKKLNHPVVGELMLDWDTFRYAAAPGQQLVLWSAEPGSVSEQRLEALAARI
jgi:transcriptional regulator with XRE-family HTH domain